MKRLQKLVNVNTYLKTLTVPDYPDITPIRIVNSGDATSRLTKVSGDQLLIARPEAYENGTDSDGFSESVVLAFFAIANINSASATTETEEEGYDRTLDMCRSLLDRICADNTSGNCGLLGGLVIAEVNIVPEYSIFGGWSGWSVEIVFD